MTDYVPWVFDMKINVKLSNNIDVLNVNKNIKNYIKFLKQVFDHLCFLYFTLKPS